MTRHLYQFFPQLQGEPRRVEASTVAEVVQEMGAIAEFPRLHSAGAERGIMCHDGYWLERVRERSLSKN